VRRLGDVSEFLYGKSLPSKERRPGPAAVVGSAGIIGTHDEAIVNGPGIVVGRKGNVGAVWWMETDFYPIDTTYYVKSRQPLGFVYWQLQGLEFIDSHAAVPGLSRSQAMSLPVIAPDQEVVQRFDVVNRSVFRAMSALRSQADSLATTRDLLLPRLVTGRLDVSDVDLGDLLPADAA